MPLKQIFSLAPADQIVAMVMAIGFYKHHGRQVTPSTWKGVEEAVTLVSSFLLFLFLPTTATTLPSSCLSFLLPTVLQMKKIQAQLVVLKKNVNPDDPAIKDLEREKILRHHMAIELASSPNNNIATAHKTICANWAKSKALATVGKTKMCKFFNDWLEVTRFRCLPFVLSSSSFCELLSARPCCRSYGRTR